jgi:tRNA pseudouridine55 synthase
MEYDFSNKDYDFNAGAVLLVDKPKDWTSFDVVNKLRFKIKHLLGVKKIKVGHAGTLDPMATGLLIICTGKFTKRIDGFQGMPKSYVGTMKLGETTPSYDAETEVDGIYPFEHITTNLVEEKKADFVGDIQQLPPMYSAIKVDGQPLYKKARKGIVVEVKPRPVSITRLEFPKLELPFLDFEADCSKGTYIRSLAYDLGKSMGSGAYLTRLSRTSIGDFKLEDAWNLEELVAHIEGMEKPGE